MTLQALDYYGSSLSLFVEVLHQKRGDKIKRYSLHEPAVWCIAKGKAHNKYKFGCKVSVARGAESGVILGIKSFTGNPYDGSTLEASLDQVQRVREVAGGNRPQRAVGDRGYRGSKQVGTTAILIPGRGNKNQTYYEKQKQRKRFRRRAGIEPVIGHLKSDHRMLRNYLAGDLGDAANCLLAGAAFNLKMRLNQLRASFWIFLTFVPAMLLLGIAPQPLLGRNIRRPITCALKETINFILESALKYVFRDDYIEGIKRNSLYLEAILT